MVSVWTESTHILKTRGWIFCSCCQQLNFSVFPWNPFVVSSNLSGMGHSFPQGLGLSIIYESHTKIRRNEYFVSGHSFSNAFWGSRKSGWEELWKSSLLYETKGCHFHNLILGSRIIFDEIVILELEYLLFPLCFPLTVWGH